MLIVNCKAYQKATGAHAVELAKKAERVAREFELDVFLAVQAVDLFRVSSEVKIPILAQHVESREYGPHTGVTIPDAIKENGGAGTLLNHTENRIKDRELLKKTVEHCKRLGMTVVACTSDIQEAKTIAEWEPQMVAFEDTFMLGTGKSVSTIKPNFVEQFVRELKSVDRAIADGEEAGFVKVHVRKGTDEVLGATIVARHAGEMISEISFAMSEKIGLGAIANVIHPYPTQAEAIKQVADEYNRTRLTPLLKKIIKTWLRFKCYSTGK